MPGQCYSHYVLRSPPPLESSPARGSSNPTPLPVTPKIGIFTSTAAEYPGSSVANAVQKGQETLWTWGLESGKSHASNLYQVPNRRDGTRPDSDLNEAAGGLKLT